MVTLKKELSDLSRYALSYLEIEKCIKGKVPGLVISFQESTKAKWTKHIFGKANVVIVLLELMGQNHWVCFSKTGFFYDSLAYSKAFYKKNFPDFYNFLIMMKFEWNKWRHQPLLSSSATCGDHVLCRCIHFEMKSNNEFHKWMTSLGIKTDKVASLICYLATRKLKI